MLRCREDDGVSIEPYHFVPLLPLLLLNGPDRVLGMYVELMAGCMHSSCRRYVLCSCSHLLNLFVFVMQARAGSPRAGRRWCTHTTRSTCSPMYVH